jgi:hypothetical protein
LEHLRIAGEIRSILGEKSAADSREGIFKFRVLRKPRESPPNSPEPLDGKKTERLRGRTVALPEILPVRQQSWKLVRLGRRHQVDQRSDRVLEDPVDLVDASQVETRFLVELGEVFPVVRSDVPASADRDGVAHSSA